MRISLAPFLFFFVFIACGSKESDSSQTRKEEPEKNDTTRELNFYRFKDSVLDLNDLKTHVLFPRMYPEFKIHSKYKRRFNEGRWFQLPKDSVLTDKYCTYKFTNPSVIKITNPDYEVSYIDLPIEYFDNGIEQMPYTIPYEEGIVLVYDVKDSLYYNIYKIDWTGKIIQSANVEHTKVSHPKKNENHYDFYLYPIAYSDKQLVFSSNWSSYSREKTVIVDLDFLTVHEYDKKVNGLVWDDQEEKLVGFIYPKELIQAKEPLDTPVYYDIVNDKETILPIKYFRESSSTLLINDTLIVANYHPIATGASLQAFDVKTGYLVWEADVKQMMVDHSKYFNKVILSSYDNKIIMEGNEAFGDYLQIFDLTSGKRLKTMGNFNDK